MTRKFQILQLSDDWWRQRRGKITGSKAHRVMNGTPKGWKTLMRELSAERLQDHMPEELQVPALIRGRELESRAVAGAGLNYHFDPRQVGFVQHPDFDYLGASSDFLVKRPKKKGGVINGECKAYVSLEKHMEVVMNKRMPEAHRPQITLQMAVHNSALTYFVSHHPDAVHWYWRTVVVQVPRDQAYLDNLLTRCVAFWGQYTFQSDHPDPSQIDISSIF